MAAFSYRSLHAVHYDGSGFTLNRELPVPHKIPSYCILIKSILELVEGRR